MCEKRVVTAVLSGDLLRHRQECINHYFEGLWFGIMAGWGNRHYHRRHYRQIDIGVVAYEDQAPDPGVGNGVSYADLE
jgi:hypothetical protein